MGRSARSDDRTQCAAGRGGFHSRLCDPQVASDSSLAIPKVPSTALSGVYYSGAIAVGLARLLGRPLVVRMVGEDRLNRWEHVARLDSLPIWFILMLAPFGDVPYYIAGLTSLPIWKIIAVAALVRTPSVLIATAVGAGVIDYRNPFFIAGVVIVVIVAVVALRYQTQNRALRQIVLLPGTQIDHTPPSIRCCAGHPSARRGEPRLRCSLKLTTPLPPNGKAGS